MTEDEEKPIGKLTGKTTSHTVKIKIQDTSIRRNSFFIIYLKDEGEKKAYIFNIVEMWSEKKGLMAKLQVLGERPPRPFDMGAEVYLAKDDQITEILGIFNDPAESISLGKLLDHPFNVNLLVKNFGRIFITGKSGSGKSYTMGVLVEEFLKKGIPVVILDRHGEYSSLKVSADDSEEVSTKTEDIEGSEVEINLPQVSETSVDENDDVMEADVVLIPQKGESPYINNIIEFADLRITPGADIDIEYLFSLNSADIVAPYLCTIVNFRGMDLDAQEIVAGKILKKLYVSSTAREIPPFYLFLDEAHLFAGKKQTETCEIVKLFAQEGRKFGANIVIGTQRPQLLDTTIRAQAGTWIIHNLTDIRDIGITISSAEDLSKENKEDISGLDKGEAIISGEAVNGIPLFVKIRKRITKHGGIGFDPLAFLSDKTIEELKKRKDRILGNKSEEELEESKSEFQEILSPKSSDDYLSEIIKLKQRIKALEGEITILKQQVSAPKEPTFELSGDVDQQVKDLMMEVNVWREKYNYIKDKQQFEVSSPVVSAAPSDDGRLAEMSMKILDLENQVVHWKTKYGDAIRLAEKSIAELKNPTKKQ